MNCNKRILHPYPAGISYRTLKRAPNAGSLPVTACLCTTRRLEQCGAAVVSLVAKTRPLCSRRACVRTLVCVCSDDARVGMLLERHKGSAGATGVANLSRWGAQRSAGRCGTTSGWNGNERYVLSPERCGPGELVARCGDLRHLAKVGNALES